jgi:hypothetical protein
MTRPPSSFMMVRVSGADFDAATPCVSCGHCYAEHFLRNDGAVGGCDRDMRAGDGHTHTSGQMNPVHYACACDGFTARFHLVRESVVSPVQEQADAAG